MIQTIAGDEQMQKLGEKIGQAISRGQTIELVGDVGAGKTTLTKGIARGMGVVETVQSPSFTISQRYATATDLELIHYDFYRLSEPGIMADELADEVANENSVTVIEWSDIAVDVLPKERLTIRFIALSETDRQLEFVATGEMSRQLVERVAL